MGLTRWYKTTVFYIYINSNVQLSVRLLERNAENVQNINNVIEC